MSIAKAREEFEDAARELVELNKVAQRTRDFSRLSYGFAAGYEARLRLAVPGKNLERAMPSIRDPRA